MTLHEAMIRVLETLPNKSATARLLSDEIKKKQLYRKQDGGFADATQIRARARNYQQYFELDGANIKLMKEYAEPVRKKRKRFLLF